jgi:hypothetical protein
VAYGDVPLPGNEFPVHILKVDKDETGHAEDQHQDMPKDVIVDGNTAVGERRLHLFSTRGSWDGLIRVSCLTVHKRWLYLKFRKRVPVVRHYVLFGGQHYYFSLVAQTPKVGSHHGPWYHSAQ